MSPNECYPSVQSIHWERVGVAGVRERLAKVSLIHRKRSQPALACHGFPQGKAEKADCHVALLLAKTEKAVTNIDNCNKCNKCNVF